MRAFPILTVALGVAAAWPGGGLARIAPLRPAPSPASAALAPRRAGARPIALVLRLRYEMQCGWPGAGPVVVHLPAAMAVPAAIRRKAVLVDRRPAGSVAVHGVRVAVGLPPRPPIICDSIGPGTVTIRFTRAARLGNPRRPGVYTLRVREGRLAFTVEMRIRPR